MVQREQPRFLDLPPIPESDADVVVLPLPFERTVSYGEGTAGGPRAILSASRQIELFDEETGADFEKRPRICTAPALEDDLKMPLEEYLERVASKVRSLRGKFVLALGGEHTITYGVTRGLVDDLPHLTVVQIDAHADLIDELEGRRWSHGTVMRRLWEEGCRIIQIGVRSLSREEHELSEREDRIETHYAHQLGHTWTSLLDRLRTLSGPMYLSVDVDGLDPAVIPSTGTPQPEGLTWRQAMDVLAALSQSRAQWLGADIVEFIPSPNPPGCDSIAAKLAARILVWREHYRR